MLVDSMRGKVIDVDPHPSQPALTSRKPFVRRKEFPTLMMIRRENGVKWAQ